MSKLPPLGLLWANYPTDPDPESIKRMIGGRVDLPWITNTCTIRMSYAFNRAGSPIPRKHPSLTTVRGGDGLWYAIRVREFKRYLEREFGAPGVTGTMRSEFAGHQGILVFDVEGWNDATGHLDVWNGTRAKHGEYWEAAKAVYLWICE
jgi:hypothetical protein